MKYFLIFLLFCFPVLAKDHHRDNDDHQGNEQYQSREDHHDNGHHQRAERFDDDDRQIIIKYYKEHKRIPPGHRKRVNVVVNQTITPEVLKIAVPLPPMLLPLLPPPPPGIVLLMIDGTVVRMDQRTKTVLECVPIIPVPVPPILFPIPIIR